MAVISFNTKFDLTPTNPVVIFTDTTDWAGQSISLSNVNGCFKIVSPSGITVYNNTDFTNSGCDIKTSVSLTSQQTIVLPLTSAYLVEPGLYTITYKQYNSALSVYYEDINTYTYEYIAPEICINHIIDCISPQFTSEDITDYDVENITPTKTIVHTIYYPNGSAGQGSPVVGTSPVLSTGIFYNGVETSEIVASLSYTFDDGLVVVDEISASKDATVSCEYICPIYCCIRSLEQQVMANKGVNQVEYNRLFNILHQVTDLVVLAELAIACGKPNDVNCYLDQIRTLSNCTSDCSCSGDEPSKVTGLGGVSRTTIVDAGANMSVTSSNVGTTYTYTVATNINTVKDWDNTSDDITGSPTSFILPSLSATAVTAGKYLMLFNATGILTTVGAISYGFRIGSTDLTTDTKGMTLSDVTAPTFQNMSLSAIETLTAGAIVTVKITGSPIPDATIQLKGLQLIKLS